MCCGGRICMMCTCLIVVVIVIGFVFGFGVFKHGFHKVENVFHVSCDPNSTTFCGGGGGGGSSSSSGGRPFFSFNAPPPSD